MKQRGCFLALALLAGVVRSEPVRIMPLGDSITQGQVRYGSYRRPLWLMLEQAGYRVDFVGSQQRQRGGGPRSDDYDPDHEGHWGWSLDQVLPRLPEWLEKARPDVVLLHLGTNDQLRGHPMDESVAEWMSVLRMIYASNPETRVLAARLIPARGSEEPLARFNDAIAAAWSNQPIPGLELHWVDQCTGFQPETDTWDGLHPNHQGDQKIAARWLEVLRNILPPVSPSAALKQPSGRR